MRAAVIVLAFCVAACSGWDYMQDLKLWDPSICCYPIPPGCCPACLECIDVAFILDDSGSITTTQFAAIKAFFMALIMDERLPAHPDFQSALVKFSRNPTLVWNWGQVTTEQQYIDSVTALVQEGQFTEPVPAMQLVMSDVIGSDGDRPECPNTCVIITDGLAQDSIANLEAAGDDLRAACGSLFVIGVTINIPPAGLGPFEAQLLAMAGNNPDYVFSTEDFDGLLNLFSDIIDMWCEEFGSGSSSDKCCPFDYIYMVTKKPKSYW